MNKLFYGDNLSVLRESIATESVNLIYGLSELTVADRTSLMSCRKVGKTRVFTPVRESSGESRNKEAILVERIILHAGTPKTGTTSLQIALERHRAQIACHGLLYPTTMATAYSTSDGRGGVK